MRLTWTTSDQMFPSTRMLSQREKSPSTTRSVREIKGTQVHALTPQPALRLLTEKISLTKQPWPEHLILTTKEVVDVDPSDGTSGLPPPEALLTGYRLEARDGLVRFLDLSDWTELTRKLQARFGGCCACAEAVPKARHPLRPAIRLLRRDGQVGRTHGACPDQAGRRGVSPTPPRCMLLTRDRTTIKKSEAARRQRELKKFGKQIQQEKIKQREQDKKSFNERVQGIKRSQSVRHEPLTRADESRAQGWYGSWRRRRRRVWDRGRRRRAGRGWRSGRTLWSWAAAQGQCLTFWTLCVIYSCVQMPRSARDAKYSLGGGGKRSKQNTRESTMDFGGGGGSGGRGGFGGGRGGGRGGRGGGKAGRGGARPGKSRRHK